MTLNNLGSSKRKICCVINSRANYARIKSVLTSLSIREDCELQIVVGASGLLFRFGNVSQIIRNDGFRISRELYTVVEGNEPVVMAKTTGLSLLDLASTFQDLKPDLVVTVADRHETLATAIAASYMNIPLAHTQGGEITGSIDESVRHACTKLAHLHFPATEQSYRNIIQMGEESHRVHLVGCPALDLIKESDSRNLNGILAKYIYNSESFKSDNYFLVLLHPDTQDYMKAGLETQVLLEAVSSFDIPAIWLWPNVDSGTDFISKELRLFRDKNRDSKINFVRNFSPEDYAAVLNSAACIIGNSSSGIREAALTGTPSVSLGSRQFGRESADNVIHVDEFSYSRIVTAIKDRLLHGRFEPSNLYGSGDAGKKIAEVLCTTKLSLEKKFVRRYS